MNFFQAAKGILLIFLLQAAILYAPQAKAQHLDALLDLNRYRITDSTAMLDIGILVAGRSVAFKQASKGKFQAKVSVTIQISDSVGIRAADKLMMLSPVVADTSDGNAPNFQVARRFLLPNGNYTLQITSKDVHLNGPESKVEVPVELNFGQKGKIQISDVFLLASFKKTDQPENSSSFIRNGFELTPAMTNFYPPAINTLSFYTEIYRASQILSPDESFLVTYGIYPERSRSPLTEFSKHSKQKAQTVNPIMASLDITTLPSGNYRFGLEVRDKTNKLLASVQRPIQRSSQEAATLAESAQKTRSAADLTFSRNIDSTKITLYLQSLQPIANTNEISFISGLIKSGKLEDQRRYLEHFWQKRSATDPQGLWLDYQGRIDYVEKTFGLKNYRGYQTDRGRVYLQYGPPNKIDNERTDVQRRHNTTDIIPYQIWHYYHVGNYNNKVFVFVQGNLGNDNYRLTHSDMPGEVNFPDWRQELVKQNFSGNKK